LPKYNVHAHTVLHFVRARLDREHDGDGASRLSQCEANAAMALRWTAAGMMEAAKGFRRLKAYRLFPLLKAALVAHATEHVGVVEKVWAN
jgi:hypothetical protein